MMEEVDMGDKETHGAPQDEDDTQPVSKEPSIVEKEPSIDEKQEDFIDSDLLGDDSVILYENIQNGDESSVAENSSIIPQENGDHPNGSEPILPNVNPELKLNNEVAGDGFARSDEETSELSSQCNGQNEDQSGSKEREEEQGLSNQELERQNSDLICTNEEQRKVIEMLRTELTKKDDELLSSENGMKKLKEKAEIDFKKLQEESTRKFAELKKAYEQANREKESMVIKYAMGEKDILIARKSKEVAEKKFNEANKDKEGLQYKIKTLSNERTRLQGLCDSRGQETQAAKRDGDKLKEEIKQAEAKLLAATSKLTAETEAHKETSESLQRTLAQLAEVQGSVDKVKADCQEVLDLHKKEEMKAKMVEKEQEVKLMIDSATASELELIKKKHKSLLDENNELSVKVQAGEKERLNYESLLSGLKETAQKQKTEIVDLYAKCAELESLKIQFDREQDKCAAKDSEVVRLRSENAEIQADMTTCRKKEAELLEYTQKLTDKNVILQSEFTDTEVRARTLEEEHTRLVTSLAKSETVLSEVESRVRIESHELRAEKQRLDLELADSSAACATALQQAIDAKNEVDVLRRQHTSRVRELTKELNAHKRRLETLDPERSYSPGLSQASRTSSNSSLNTLNTFLEPGTTLRPMTSPRVSVVAPVSPIHPYSKSVNGYDKAPDVNRNQVECNIPDRQVLVEKIVKLQRACARRQEKLDFLEEHSEQLVHEVKKKNKIIHAYIQNIEPGALISEESDIHKAVIGQQGGIMSSIYGSKVKDSGMTLELCLEMNQKLQAVLEDTLLKNITLKDNMSTLGTEIAKMSMKKN